MSIFLEDLIIENQQQSVLASNFELGRQFSENVVSEQLPIFHNMLFLSVRACVLPFSQMFLTSHLSLSLSVPTRGTATCF